jgi:hypothetical protein
MSLYVASLKLVKASSHCLYRVELCLESVWAHNLVDFWQGILFCVKGTYGIVHFGAFGRRHTLHDWIFEVIMILCWTILSLTLICFTLVWLLLPLRASDQGILKGEVSLYSWPPVWLVWNKLYDYWQILFLFVKQTNPNESNRRSMVQWYFSL